MTIKSIYDVSMMKRVKVFILERPFTPPNVRVTALTGVLTSSISAAEIAAQEQSGGSGIASGGTATKAERARDLREYLKNVTRTARAFDRIAHPGVAEQFALPDSRSYSRLLAAAQAMIVAATPLEAEFIAHEMPATFLADMGALVTAFEAALTQQADGEQLQVGGTLGLKVRIADGIRAVRALDAIIRNRYRNDPVTLGIWRTARHIERLPQRSGSTAAGSGAAPAAPAPSPAS